MPHPQPQPQPRRRSYPDTLLLVSLYGLLDALVKLACGSAIGSFVDRTERWPAATAMYCLQNGCIAASAVCAGLLIWLHDGQQLQQQVCARALRRRRGLRWRRCLAGALPSWGAHSAAGRAARPTPSHPRPWPRPPQARVALTALTIGLGALSSAGSIGISICVERDWTKALCGSDDAALARMNAVMRRIDLLSLMLAPILSGLLMSYAGMLVAVGAIAAYNTAAWLPEARLLAAAQRRSPELQAPKRGAAGYEQLDAGPGKSAAGALAGALAAPFTNLASGWGTYLRQPVLLPALALAMLYFTVLSLGFLMTAYVKRSGLSELVVSLFRAAGALTGILATFVYPALHSRLGILRAGAVGIGYQLLCLLLGVLPVFFHQAGVRSSGASPAALLYVMMGGLAASRTGLWLFDLCVSQLLQDEVAPAELGARPGRALRRAAAAAAAALLLPRCAAAAVGGPPPRPQLGTGEQWRPAEPAPLLRARPRACRCGQRRAGQPAERLRDRLLRHGCALPRCCRGAVGAAAEPAAAAGAGAGAAQAGAAAARCRAPPADPLARCRRRYPGAAAGKLPLANAGQLRRGGVRRAGLHAPLGAGARPLQPRAVRHAYRHRQPGRRTLASGPGALRRNECQPLLRVAKGGRQSCDGEPGEPVLVPERGSSGSQWARACCGETTCKYSSNRQPN